MSEHDHEFLRAAGIHLTDAELTKERADLDQFRAEIDHLIDHALSARAASPEDAAKHVLSISTHIDAHIVAHGHPSGLLCTLVFRAAQLADTLVTCDAKLQQAIKERDETRQALAAAKSGRTTWRNR